MAAFEAHQVSTRAACGCRRDHGFGDIFNSISRDASDAAVAALGSNCGSTLPAHPDAARPGRGHHLDSGAPRVVVRGRAAVALLDLRHSYRNRFYSDSD